MPRVPRFLTAIATGLALTAIAPVGNAQNKGPTDASGPVYAQSEKGMEKGHGNKQTGADKVKAKKGNHHNGKDMLGEKIKTNGHHVVDKKGDYTAAVDVQDGKIAGMKVTHAKNGAIPVTKYKTTKKMASADVVGSGFIQVQSIYLGTTYIGYSYIDDYGDEEIYWYPYDMILDGDTGAIEYLPVYS